MPTVWTVHRTSNTRFPFRVAFERDGRIVIAVRATSPWPGPGQQVFCLREDGSDPEEPMELVERVPVLTCAQLGRKLTVVLDRPLRKRCEFLFIAKAYRDKPGTYEQVFFRTEAGIRSHRSRSRLEVRPNDATLQVVIDSGEKYACALLNAGELRVAVGAPAPYRRSPCGSQGGTSQGLLDWVRGSK